MHLYSYLALGDSYTIGEAVPLNMNFPYRVIKVLRKKGLNFFAPEIIAKTGWTTDELLSAITEAVLLPKYDFVSLLIGVNNQFRGRGAIEYKEQFEELLKKAIELTNGKKDRVLVLSIPDYSVTPFAKAMDTEKISKEIEVFNSINKAVSIQYKVHYIDLTSSSSQSDHHSLLTAQDGLHPSEKEYEIWAKKIADYIASQLK